MIQNNSSTIKNKPAIDYLNDDLRFLIACCKNEPSSEDIDFIFSYLNAEHFELNALIGLANQHGVLPLVYKTIKYLSHLELNSDTPVIKMKEGCSDNLSATRYMLHTKILTELKAHYMSISQRNMLMSSELIRIIKLLKDNNIEALAFKGPVLAQMAYADITMRQFSDLDILINSKDFLLVYKILTDNSYFTKCNYDRALNKVLELTPDHMFINTSSQIPIEIHNKLFASSFPVQITHDIFWDNSINITINSKLIPTFKNEYLLFYLCLHGCKHLFSKISWIKDIAMLINSTSKDFDWKLFRQITRDHNLNTMTSVGLHLSVILFQAKIPHYILQEIKNNKRSFNIARAIIKRLNKNAIDSKHFSLVHLKMFDSITEKIKYSIHFFKPSILDYQMFKTEYKLNIIYYIIRFFRLTNKYVRKIFMK